MVGIESLMKALFVSGKREEVVARTGRARQGMQMGDKQDKGGWVAAFPSFHPVDILIKLG